MERQKTRDSRHNIEEEQGQRTGASYVTPHCAAEIIKPVLYRWKNRHIDKWSKLESPETDPHNVVS